MKADDRTRTDNLLITNQLLCQLSHIGTFSHLKKNGTYRARTYDPLLVRQMLSPAELRSHHNINITLQL